MTRAQLLALRADVECAARDAGKRVQYAIREGATSEQISRCEEVLGFILPQGYRAQLCDWNGCVIEIYERSEERPDREYQSALFEILDTVGIAAATKIVVERVVEVAGDSHNEAALPEWVSSGFVVKDQDDYAAIVRSFPDTLHLEPSVWGADMVLLHEILPRGLPQIAQAVDEYLRRSLVHLTKTLETDLYWR